MIKRFGPKETFVKGVLEYEEYYFDNFPHGKAKFLRRWRIGSWYKKLWYWIRTNI